MLVGDRSQRRLGRRPARPRRRSPGRWPSCRGRHVEHLTGKLTPVGQHAKRVHAHALEALFFVQGKKVEYFLQDGRGVISAAFHTGGARACVVVVKALLGGFERGRPRAP